jgi:glycosyltransferase involved in cell wall biosynthesis
MPGRILYIEATRNGVVGGSLTCLLKLIKSLDSEEYVPFVVFHSDFSIRPEFEKYGKVYLVPKIGKREEDRNKYKPSWIRRLRWFLSDLFSDVLPGVRTLSRIIRQEAIDIVHINNGLEWDFEGIIAAKLCRVKCVVHQRGVGKLSRIPRWLAGYVDSLICISHAVERDILSQNVTARNHGIIYDGIDLAEIETADNDRVRTELGLREGQPVVGIVGTIQPWKGQREVIQAVRRVKEKVPDVQCLVVGGVYDDRYDQEVRHLVRELGLTENVRFLGYRKDVLNVMNAMDIVIHASTSPEPFGMVLIEAMALGKPVIATRAGGPLEIVEDQVSGLLVPPGNPDALAEAISRLLEDRTMAEDMGCSGRKRVKQMFPLKRTIEGIRSVYAELR